MATILTNPPQKTVINPGIQQNASGLKQNLNQSQADAAVVQMYLTAILQQPDIVQNVVPDLPKIQAEARSVAKTWTSDVLPKTTQTVTDLIGFSNQWNAYKSHMMSYAQQIASNSTDAATKAAARHNLDLMLGQVYSSVEAKENNAVTASNLVTSFSNAISSNNKQFDSALQTLRKAYSGERGIIATIDGQINTANHNIAKDATLISVSALSTIGGAIMITVGAVTEFESAGTSTSLILAGIGMTAGGISGIAASAADLHGQIKTLGKLEAAKTKAEQEYSAIQTSISQVSMLDNKCSDAVTSSKDLANLWNGLKSDIDVLRNDIKAINPGDYSVVHSIQYANSDWDSCLQLAKTIQANTAGGSIPVKTGTNGQYPNG